MCFHIHSRQKFPCKSRPQSEKSAWGTVHPGSGAGGLDTPTLRMKAGGSLSVGSRLLGVSSSPWASHPATWPGAEAAGGELSDHHTGCSWLFTEQPILQRPHRSEDTSKPSTSPIADRVALSKILQFSASVSSGVKCRCSDHLPGGVDMKIKAGNVRPGTDPGDGHRVSA